MAEGENGNRRLYALVLENPRLLSDILRDAKRGEVVIRGIVVFVEATPQKAGGYSQRGAAVLRLERFALNLTLSVLLG